jgi:hypothetical protein
MRTLQLPVRSIGVVRGAATHVKLDGRARRLKAISMLQGGGWLRRTRLRASQAPQGLSLCLRLMEKHPCGSSCERGRRKAAGRSCPWSAQRRLGPHHQNEDEPPQLFDQYNSKTCSIHEVSGGEKVGGCTFGYIC